MYAIMIMATHEYYGPFVNREAAMNYAKNHVKTTTWTMVWLQDSCRAMDYQGKEGEYVVD